MRTYKLATGWLIFALIFTGPLIALFAWMLTLPFTSDVNEKNRIFLITTMIPISLAMIAYLIFGLMDAIKGRFIIDKEKLTSIGALRTRVIGLSDVKGYRFDRKYIFIESSLPGAKRIKISKYYGKVHEIETWLAMNYDDLDQRQSEVELSEILVNEELGWTVAGREQKLKTAKTVSRVINAAGVIVGVWGFFKPEPYNFVIIIGAIIPLVALAAARLSNGLIRIDERKDSAHPSILYALLATSVMLFLRAIMDFNLISHNILWQYTTVITALLSALAFVGNKELTFRKAQGYLIGAAVLMILVAYSYGVLVTFNSHFDQSEPDAYSAKVIDKHISDGRIKAHYLTLSPWGPLADQKDVTVTSEQYESISPADEVTINLHRGSLGFPWFYVVE